MKVLITGAGGFLGSATAHAFHLAGHSVVATARQASEKWVGCDLADPRALVALLKEHQPEAIVNCAAVADFSEGVLPKLFSVNALAPAILASWCAANRAYLVQISGTLVHGVHTDRIDEGTSIHPDTDYGRAKWLAEEMVRASGTKSATIRFGGIFGAQGPGHLGLNRAIRAAREGIAPRIFGKGLAERNYIHVSDAADMLVACVEKQLVGVRWAGGQEILSVASMLKTLSEVYGIAEPVFEDGQEASDQIVKTSTDLPSGKSFAEALASER